MFDLGGPAMGLSNRGRRNERLLRGDEDDEYDENPKGILSLLEENARLRRLRIKQSSMILKSVAEQIAKFIALDVAGQDTTMAKRELMAFQETLACRIIAPASSRRSSGSTPGLPEGDDGIKSRGLAQSGATAGSAWRKY
jgi:hypothetical protein